MTHCFSATRDLGQSGKKRVHSITPSSPFRGRGKRGQMLFLFFPSQRGGIADVSYFVGTALTPRKKGISTARIR